MSDTRHDSNLAGTTSDERRPAGTKRAEAGIGTILVVEDDPDIRELAVSFVARLGYDVLEAEDCASALAVLDSGNHVDLLFTDVVMPGMSGIELSRQARLRLPSLKVILASGYTDDVDSEGLEAQEQPISL